MQAIDGMNITLTRGDTLAFEVGMKKGNQTYTPVEGDKLRFALSIGYVGEQGYQLIKSQDIDTTTRLVVVDAETTAGWTEDEYNYDIELTYADGKVDTFIQGMVFMVGECE